MSRGRFIVLEALDGVGKTTLAEGLALRLGGLATHTPGPALREVTPHVLDSLGTHQTARCLYYAASVLSAGERSMNARACGQTVVMDRYWLSTFSYARARGVLLDLSAIEREVPAPDATILLTLDEGERQHRLRQRGHTEADRETLDERFRKRVLLEMQSQDRVAHLRPTAVVDLTGADRLDAIARVFRALPN